jgi:hypothetical protein
MVAEYSAEQRAANDIIRDLPAGRDLGTFTWEPTRFYDTLPNQPLFTTSGVWSHYVVDPVRMGIYDQLILDYGL